MADFISDLATKAGVSPDLARKGVGAILALFKDKLPAGSFSQVQSAIPNASNLMAGAQAALQEAPSGGVLGAVNDHAPSNEGGLELVEPAVEVAQRLAPHGGGARLPVRVRGRRLGGGPEAPVHVVQRTLELRVADRGGRAFPKVGARSRDVGAAHASPAASRSATWIGCGPAPIR